MYPPISHAFRYEDWRAITEELDLALNGPFSKSEEVATLIQRAQYNFDLAMRRCLIKEGEK
jgi:hypothetical protein